MLYFLSIGAVLGLSAGFAPGPLLALVISETLKNDIQSGIKVSLAPVITDLPIILGAVFIFSMLSNFHSILGVVSLIGGCFVLMMGYGCIRTDGAKLDLKDTKSKSLTKGMLVNVLSPYPYLFWLSVGAPLVAKAQNVSTLMPFIFIGTFYIVMVGSKILLAIVVGKSKLFLSGDVYIYIMRFLGFVLFGLAIALFIDGFKLLGR